MTPVSPSTRLETKQVRNECASIAMRGNWMAVPCDPPSSPSLGGSRTTVKRVWGPSQAFKVNPRGITSDSQYKADHPAWLPRLPAPSSEFGSARGLWVPRIFRRRWIRGLTCSIYSECPWCVYRLLLILPLYNLLAPAASRRRIRKQTCSSARARSSKTIHLHHHPAIA